MAEGVTSETMINRKKNAANRPPPDKNQLIGKVIFGNVQWDKSRFVLSSDPGCYSDIFQ